MNRPSTSALAAAVTAVTLAVSGVVMAAIDDERPMIVRSASDAAPFTEPPATTEPARVESTTTTEADDETSTTTARRVQPSPATATTTAPVETEQAGPVDEATTTTSTPPTTSAPSRWVAPWEENYPTTTTTTTPPEKKWVTIARFEWDQPQSQIMRVPVTLETGVIRVRTSYDRFENQMYAWFDDEGLGMPTTAGCHPTSDNPGTMFYYSQPDTDENGRCTAFEGPWPIGDHVAALGKYVMWTTPNGGTGVWRGPQLEGSHVLWVEELR